MANISVRMPDGTLQEMTHPDDWTEEQVKQAIYKNFPEHAPKDSQSEIAPTPFNDRPLPKPERTGFKGLGADVLEGLGNALKSGRGFIKDLPGNLEKSGKNIEENPGSSILHNAGQIAAGTADIGKSLFNTPHDLLKYALKKHLAIDIPIPGTSWHTSDLIPHIPENTGVEQTLGIEADPKKGDAIFRAIPEIAGLAAGGTSLIGKGKKLFKAPDLKQALRDVQAKVNKANADAGKVFDMVENEVSERGISKISIDKKIISQAQKILPNTKATRALIERADTGDFKALRQLQSDLRLKGEKARSSDSAGDRELGDIMLETRNDVNEAIEDHLQDTGHEDLARALTKVRKEYANLQKTYYSTPALKKVFDKSQSVPKDPVTLLTQENTEMNRFMKAHPELKTELGKVLKHKRKKEKAILALKYLGTPTAGGIIGGIIGNKYSNH